MELKHITECFNDLGYQVQHETKKVVGYKAPKTRRVAYLRKDSGLPAHARIVIDPDCNPDSIFALDGIKRPKTQYQHGSNMGMLPKRRNKGENDIPYGIAVNAITLDGLARALRTYDV